MNYTLILYKSSGCNTCRSCVMETWDSEFSVDVGISEDVAINKISDAFTYPSDGGSYVAYLSFQLNNNSVAYEFEQYGGVSWIREPGGYNLHGEFGDDYDSACANAKRINDIIRDTCVSIIKSRELALKKVEEQKRELELKRQEKAERQQLEQLKQKYETTKTNE